MEDIKVSILVPVYGVESYIERCARSIFEQTYHNLEIIFVDDCTPDKSIDIVKSVLEEYPERKEQTRIIRHEKNRGLAAARNTAVAAATGEFISHVDSDDWLESTAIEYLADEVNNNDCDIVTGQIIRYFQDGWTFLERPQFYNKEDFVIDMVQLSNHHSLWGRLIKRSLYKENNIYAIEGLNVGEDMQVMAKLAYYSQKVSTIKEVVYHYDNTNETSYMNQKNVLKTNLQDIQTVEKLCSFFLARDEHVLSNLKADIVYLMNTVVMTLAFRREWKQLDETGRNFLRICSKYNIEPSVRLKHIKLYQILYRIGFVR